MRKPLVAVAVLGAVAAGYGGAAAAGAGSSNDGGVAARRAAAPDTANVTKARLAAFVLADGSVVYSKGVKSVTSPAVGHFCIKPKGKTDIDVTRAVPSVTVDWSNSSGNALMAHWRSSSFGCPAGRIEVQTVNGSDGTFDVDGGVAFTIVVP
jgi:hypothetical protein